MVWEVAVVRVYQQQSSNKDAAAEEKMQQIRSIGMSTAAAACVQQRVCSDCKNTTTHKI